MRRRMELIRALALKMEEVDEAVDTGEIAVEGFTQEEIIYHCILMKEAGLIDCPDDWQTVDNIGMAVTRLTWAGHDFVDAARDSTLWNRAKRAIGEKVTSTTFQVFMNYLSSQATNVLSGVTAAIVNTPPTPTP